MPGSISPFSQWAHDDARTADERYLVFLVSEACRSIHYSRQPQEWKLKNFIQHVPYHMWKEYYLNPLLLPPYDLADTERAAEMAPFFVKFEPQGGHEYRRIGEAGSVLRFFPALEEVSLGITGMRDISFVEALPKLRRLLIQGGLIEDLSPLAKCSALRDLTLGLSGSGPPLFTPPLYWLDASPLAALRQLERLSFFPNPAVLSGMCFPELRFAELGGANCVQPDCAHLPDMPRLRLLKLGGIQSLRGISRFPDLRHLKIDGPLRDWGDIHSLEKLDCIEVDTQDGWPRDVTPLSRLPSLLWARFGGELPRNYWPLAQAPRLCELSVHEKTPAVQLEVAAVNAALRKWDEVFALPEPRPVPPLRFVSVEPGADHRVMPGHLPEPGPEYLRHPKLFHLELLWMNERVTAAAEKAAGEGGIEHRRWSLPSETTWNHYVGVSIQTIEAANRLPAVLDAIRGALASSPHPWQVGITINLRITERDMTEQQRQWLRQIEQRSNDWEDDFDLERYRMTQQHIIETQFRLRTTAEEGDEPDPEDFVPPEEIRPEDYSQRRKVAAGPQSGGDEDEDEEEEDNPDFELKPFDQQEQNPAGGGDDDGGSVATAPPPEPPPDFLEDPHAHPLAGSYRFYAMLTLDTFYQYGRNYATARQLLGREADEYYPAPKKEE